MKITSLSLWQFPLISHETYYMADGKTCDQVLTTILRVSTDIGLEGWGEVCPIPHYLPAYSGGVIPAVEELSDLLLGASPIGPEALMERLDAHLLGHPYAKSMIDMALWDLMGKATNRPLFDLIGGRRQHNLPLYHSITCTDPEKMAGIATGAAAEGMRQFQVKLGADSNWEADVARVRLVREAVGAGPLVYCDWNCGVDALEAIRVARAVQDTDVMLEQPCRTIAECAAVQKASGLPMKLDESITDIAAILEAYEKGCLQAAALKQSKNGGIGRLRAMRDLCASLGVRMCVEDTWGGDITTAANLHLAASTPVRNLMNTCDLGSYVAPQIAPDTPQRQHGRISPPAGAGLGITPDLELFGSPAAQFN